MLDWLQRNPQRITQLAAHVWTAGWPGEKQPSLIAKDARPDDADALLREWQALLAVPSDRLPEPVSLRCDARGHAETLWLRLRPGRPLDEVLAEKPNLPLLDVAQHAMQALAAVHAAGLVHGDLHPGNLLIDDAGRVTLLDLGLAGRPGTVQVGCGHPLFAAPDRLSQQPLDARDDLFSLAMTLWLARGWPSPYRDYPALRPQPGALLVLPVVAEADQPLLRVLAGWLALDREHRPADAERALRQLDDLTHADAAAQALSLVADLRALTGRPRQWPTHQTLPPLPSAKPLWLVGPRGSGRTSVMTALAADCHAQGQPIVTIDSSSVPALTGHLASLQQPQAFSGMADPLGQEVARWRALWHAVREGVGTRAVLLIDDVERLPGPARMALEQGDLGAIVLASDDAPEGSERWVMPAMDEREVADSLARASGGRAWDASLVRALATGAGAERSLLFPLAALLVESALAIPMAGRLELAATVNPQQAVQQVLMRQRQLKLPSPRHWPLWAELAVQPIHAVLPLRTAQAIPADDAILLRRLPNGVALASAAIRTFLRSQLPGAVLAQAALDLAQRPQNADLRVPLLLDAMTWGAQVFPDGDAVAAAVASRVQRGEATEAAAMAEIWLRQAPPDHPALGQITALQLRAMTLAGAETLPVKIARLTDAVRAAPEVRLALAEVAFRRGDYPACREVATALIADPAADVHAAGQLWLAFAATWQGDRAAAAEAVAMGQALPESANTAFFAYLAALGAYYSGAVTEAGAAFAALWGDPALQDSALHAAAASGLGLCAQRQGDLPQARTWYETAREAAERAGDRLRALNMAMNVATLDHEQGDLGRALAAYDHIVAAGRRAMNVGALARALGNRGNLLSQLGQDERARKDVNEALVSYQAQKNAYLSGNAGCVLAELARRAGQWQAAERNLARAEIELRQANAAAELVEIELERGELLRLSGRTAQARACAEQAGIAAAQLASPELEARSAWLLARLDLDETSTGLVHVARAAQALRDALARVPESKPLLRIGILADLARALAWHGDWPAAVAMARDGLARLQAIAATLPPADAQLFAHGAAYGATRLLLAALAHLPDTPHVSSLPAPHLLAPILAINRRMGAEQELQPLLEIVMDSAVLLTGAERGFLLLDHDAALNVPGSLNVMVARNLDRENLRKASLKLSWGIARQVFQNGERILTTDALQDERFRSQASVHHGSLRSILCVPMAWQGKPIGALYVDNRFAAGAFSPEHAALLEALADQAAIAVEHARVVAGERQALDKLRQSQAQVQSLAERLREQLDQTENALDDARAELVAQRMDVQRRSDYSQIRGESPALLRLFGLMDRVRDHDFPVLVCGESGTGKELVARAIHFTGRRKKGPFLAINCAALPSTLLESELFGHVRGAFTGAVVDRKGLFESADGGTLFLDEIGEMPLEMQPKLLRVLQTGELQRVGDTRTRIVNVRVLAATHRNLPEMAEHAQFRQDLLFRLRVVELQIPPLRQRLEDIPLLVEYFLSENRKLGIGRAERLTPGALRKLREFAWPGNVRQLETVLKSAGLFASGDAIDVVDLEPLLSRDKPAEGGAKRDGVAASEWWKSAPLEEIVRRAVAERVELAGGNKRRAAESLGIDRTTLYARLRHPESEK
jgi:transcriptional regulator with GAF, ATPase, and Fis domain/tetratricopeptide (TPR) repeat protein